MPAPTYESQGQAPHAGPVDLGLTPQPQLPTGENVAHAVNQAGTALGQFAEKLQHAHEEIDVANATADYLVGVNSLEKKAVENARKDYKTAPGEFQRDNEALISEVTGRISDPVKRAQLTARLTSHGLTSEGKVERVALGVESDANRAAQDEQEAAGLREAGAAASPAEKAAAVARYISGIRSAADAGTISRQEAVIRAQRFSTSIDRADAMALIRANPEEADKALANPKMFPSFDPVTRETFRAHAATAADQVRMDRITIAAQRDPEQARASLADSELSPHNIYRAQAIIDNAERQRDLDLDRAAKSAAAAARNKDDVLDLVKSGFDVGGQRIEEVRAANLAAAARGDDAAAKYVRELDLQMSLQPFVRAAWSTPPAMLDHSIKAMEADMTAAGGDATPMQKVALEAFRKVRDEVHQRRDTEAIVLGGENGARFYRLGPIDPKASPDDDNFRSELARRGGHALLAHTTFGGSAVAFTADETKALRDRYGEAGPDEKFDLLKSFSDTLRGRAYEDTVTAIAGKGAANQFVGRLARDRPELAREILQGEALLHAEGVKDKPATLHDALASKVGGQLYPDVREQSSAIEAAKALYVARRGRAGALYEAPDASVMEKAIDDVMGPIVKRNGVKVPRAPGIAPSAFDAALNRLDDDGLKLMGGARDRTGMPVDPRTIRNYGVLKPLTVGGASYVVGLPDPKSPDGFAPLHTHDFEPLVFDMRALAADRIARDAAQAKKAAAELSPYQKKREEALSRGIP